MGLLGNRIYQATPEAFLGHKLFYTLDQRDNHIDSLQNFKPLLAEKKYYQLSLLGKPLTCGCEIAWLRNNSIHENLGSLRCNSPQGFSRYLAWCFPLTGCSSMTSVSVSHKTKENCEDDSDIKLSSLTVALERNGVNVTWTKTRPGMVTGFKVEYHPVGKSVDIETSSILVHLEMEFVILTNLPKDKVYNICVTAVLHSELKSLLPVCAEVKTSYARANIVIFLATALGLCILLVLFLTACQFSRRNYDSCTSND